ncbi:uncharacterized protein AMSG_02089 [Thecamonas trahens ATCC 50062]|uniref:Protein MCM10 homolog n=1 Tax=Thecamonas trahens ATCC 50062 TaxID=461836 RepID=A0A0L0DVA4_THETB|nr:hypothetical protein AMSG_02089 [Thecamonas trahens ATCC 50062]KNC56077.1 hypothetical protein AMSG_02089 [Thecamonas trahens ATCC 50062]|eukprot:XP_013761121.1 hypothetical protein AMSG_02089 [Thecamonas trahens ATCC 50062]
MTEALATLSALLDSDSDSDTGSAAPGLAAFAGLASRKRKRTDEATGATSYGASFAESQRRLKRAKQDKLAKDAARAAAEAKGARSQVARKPAATFGLRTGARGGSGSSSGGAGVVEAGSGSKEAFSGLWLRNRVVSSEAMARHMAQRKYYPLGGLKDAVVCGDIPGEWVVIGVVASKSRVQVSGRGGKYVIWTLSDLAGVSLSLFVFGGAFEALYATPVGSVFALLNPKVLPSRERGKGLAISITGTDNVLMLGKSRDYAVCKSLTKAGAKCTNVINGSKTQYCEYHVMKEYNRVRSSRMEFNSGFGGKTKPDVASARRNLSVGTFQHRRVAAPRQSAKASPVATLRAKLAKAGRRKATVPSSADSRSLLRQIQRDMTKETTPGRPTRGKRQVLESKVAALADEDRAKFRAIAAARKEARNSSGPGASGKAVHINGHARIPGMRSEPIATNCEAIIGHGKAPVLGRGLHGSGSMSIPLAGLGNLQHARAIISTSADFAAKKAAALQRAAAHDEAVRRARERDEAKARHAAQAVNADRIRRAAALLKAKRERGDREPENAMPRLPRKSEVAARKAAAPAAPRSALAAAMGRRVDLKSTAGQAVLSAKSAHAADVAAAKKKERDARLDELEKRDNMVMQMAGIFEQECKAAKCAQCNKITLSVTKVCAAAGHTIKWITTTKRWFKCGQCRHRVTIINSRFPNRPCTKCGAAAFEKAPMYRGSTDPTNLHDAVRGVHAPISGNISYVG